MWPDWIPAPGPNREDPVPVRAWHRHGTRQGCPSPSWVNGEHGTNTWVTLGDTTCHEGTQRTIGSTDGTRGKNWKTERRKPCILHHFMENTETCRRHSRNVIGNTVATWGQGVGTFLWMSKRHRGNHIRSMWKTCKNNSLENTEIYM